MCPTKPGDSIERLLAVAHYEKVDFFEYEWIQFLNVTALLRLAIEVGVIESRPGVADS